MLIPFSTLEEEYKIVVTANGQAMITRMNGETINIETATQLMKRLNTAITVTKYLYVISGIPNRWKIGISDDPYRRAKELKGHVHNYIPLESGLCWRLETYVHNMLSRYHIGNEWFKFEDSNGRELLSILTRNVETQSHLWDFVCDPKLHELAKGSGERLNETVEMRLERG